MATVCACGAKEPAGDNGQTSIETEDTKDQQTDGEQNQQQEGSPAKILAADFRSKVEKDSMTKTEDLANAIVANQIIPFAPATMPVEPGYLNGFTEEIKGFSEATMFGPSIGSIPFIGYVFKVDGNVDDFMLNLLDKSDLRWNVCTQADEKVCEASGDLVFFVMSPLTFEE